MGLSLRGYNGLLVLVGAPTVPVGAPTNDLQISRLSPKGALGALSFSLSLYSHDSKSTSASKTNQPPLPWGGVGGRLGI